MKGSEMRGEGSGRKLMPLQPCYRSPNRTARHRRNEGNPMERLGQARTNHEHAQAGRETAGLPLDLSEQTFHADHRRSY